MFVAAVVIFRLFGAVSGADVNPPVCAHAAGRVVFCDLTAPVLMLPVFVGVLLLLVGWQTRRRG